MLKKISTLIGILAALTAVLIYVDSYTDRFASASELRAVEKRLDFKILEDRGYALQQRIWSIEDRWVSPEEIPPNDKKEMRELQMERDSVMKRMDSLLEVE